MPMNFAEPAVTQSMSTQFVPSITNAFVALAQMLDPAVAGTITGTPTGAYRINGVNLERFNGTAWSTYTLNIAGSAAQVGGIAPATAGATPGANQLIRTDASGNTYTSRISMAATNSELASPSQFMTTNGTDSFLRRSSAAQAAAAVQAAATGSWAISVTGSAGSVAWTGVTGRPTALSSFTNDVGYITSATTVAGLAPSSSGVTVGANELVRSDASGNTFLNRFSTAVANGNVATPAQFLTTIGTDNIVGKSSAAQAMAVIRTAASGSWGISVTGNAATATAVAWTGVTGRPTAVSAFTNDSGYLNATGVKDAVVGTGVGAIRALCLITGLTVDGVTYGASGTDYPGTSLRAATVAGFSSFVSGGRGIGMYASVTSSQTSDVTGTWRALGPAANPVMDSATNVFYYTISLFVRVA